MPPYCPQKMNDEFLCIAVPVTHSSSGMIVVASFTPPFPSRTCGRRQPYRQKVIRSGNPTHAAVGPYSEGGRSLTIT